MSWLQVIVLAVIQGLTEFLPISSSGHLLLPAQLSDWPDQGLAFDVAVHLGSLIAVIWYFRRDITDLISHWFAHGFSKQQTTQSLLAWYIGLASIPAVVIGFVFKDYIELYLRSPWVVVVTTLVFGLLLGAADIYARKAEQLTNNDDENMTLKKALFIGGAQALALIPGTSRSGITMTAALFAGLGREQAARFSFLLSIPIILGASIVYGVELSSASAAVNWLHFSVGLVLSGLTAYLCIYFFLEWIQRMGFMPFVWYRIALAAVLVFILLK